MNHLKVLSLYFYSWAVMRACQDYVYLRTLRSTQLGTSSLPTAVAIRSLSVVLTEAYWSCRRKNPLQASIALADLDFALYGNLQISNPVLLAIQSHLKKLE